jgi:hypothetical protein
MRNGRAGSCGDSYSRAMSAVEWRPLSWREGDGPAGGWRGEVPAALEKPLREWLKKALLEDSGSGQRWIVERLLLRFDLVVSGGDEASVDFLAHQTTVGMLVDVVDAVLDLMPVPYDSPDFVVNPPSGRTPGLPSARPRGTWGSGMWTLELRGELVRLLSDARSVLRVRADGRGLERRAGVAAEAAFEAAAGNAEAAAGAGSAAAHLREAWRCVHALHPDPVKGYSEAIKAVEAAAHSVLDPDKPMATLGIMRRDLEKNLNQFALVIEGPDGRGDAGPLLGCITLLWQGQTSRHGSMRPTRPETLEEAVMAVHLAVMLVQWFTSGAVRKV